MSPKTKQILRTLAASVQTADGSALAASLHEAQTHRCETFVLAQRVRSPASHTPVRAYEATESLRRERSSVAEALAREAYDEAYLMALVEQEDNRGIDIFVRDRGERRLIECLRANHSHIFRVAAGSKTVFAQLRPLLSPQVLGELLSANDAEAFSLLLSAPCAEPMIADVFSTCPLDLLTDMMAQRDTKMLRLLRSNPALRQKLEAILNSRKQRAPWQGPPEAVDAGA